MAMTFSLSPTAPQPDAFTNHSVVVTISLPKDLLAAMAASAASQGLAPTQWIAAAVREYVQPDLTDVLLANLEWRSLNKSSVTFGHSVKLPGHIAESLITAKDYLEGLGYSLSLPSLVASVMVLKAIAAGLLPPVA